MEKKRKSKGEVWGNLLQKLKGSTDPPVLWDGMYKGGKTTLSHTDKIISHALTQAAEAKMHRY